jgi:cell shape-determining protein MreC
MNIKNLVIFLLLLIFSGLSFFVNYVTYKTDQGTDSELVEQYNEIYNRRFSELEEELGFRVGGFNSIVTDKIGYDPSDITTLYAGIGSESAVVDGCYPTYNGILLGEIGNIKSDSTEITTIYAVDNLIVKIGEARGVLSSSLEGINVDQITRAESINVGDSIFTARTPEFGAELFIGTVKNITKSPNTPFAKAEVEYSLESGTVNLIHFICPDVN